MKSKLTNAVGTRGQAAGRWFVSVLVLFCLIGITSGANAEIALLGPAAGEVFDTTSVPFAWESTGISYSYFVTLSVNEDPWSTVLDFAYIDETPAEPQETPLELSAEIPEGTWFWRVQGFSLAGGLQDSSPIRSFTIDLIPPVATVTLVEPASSPTQETAALLTVGGIDVVVYKYRMDGGAWSAETDVSVPIELSDLLVGVHTVEVIGAGESRIWQAEGDAGSVTWEITSVDYEQEGVMGLVRLETDPPEQWKTGMWGRAELDVTFSAIAVGTPLRETPELTVWSWDFDSNGVQDSSAQNPPEPYTYTTAGGHWATVIAADNQDAWFMDYVPITVVDDCVNVPPAAFRTIEPNTVELNVSVDVGNLAGTTVTIPAEAVSKPLVLTISEVNAEIDPPPGHLAGTNMVDIGPNGAEFDPLTPVTVSIPFSDIVPEGEVLKVLLYNEAGGATPWGSANISDISAESGESIEFSATRLELFAVAISSKGYADLNNDDEMNAIDVQLVINEVLGLEIWPFHGDINLDGDVNAIDVQRVINAVLGV